MLMADIRESIEQQRFEAFCSEFYAKRGKTVPN
jgi:queuine/archaeosine tRNA-ribosyltransferase